MTLLENIKVFLALVDEFAPNNQYFTTDEDIQEKAKLLYNPVYQELANLKTNSKTKELSYTYTGQDEYEEVKLPNARKIKKIFCLDEKNRPTSGDYFYISDEKVMLSKKDKTRFLCEYIPKVDQITLDTPDDYELTLSDELVAVLPYKVASDLLKTDPSADYQAFERRANAMLQMLDTSTLGISVNITEGEL
jgi:predicted protein tyrosine phosphatase